MVTLAWIFFRAKSINVAFEYIEGIFVGDYNLKKVISWRSDTTDGSHVEFIFIMLLMAMMHVIVFNKKYKWLILKPVTLIIMILLFGNFINPADFIYFQF
jgi:hypothetical protein